MFYLSLRFLPRDKICFYCIHAREGGVLKKSFIALPLPRHSLFFFFGSCPSFLDEPREERLATQARGSTPRLLFRDRSLPGYRLGGEGGGAAEDFRGDHLMFRRTKAGISRNWEPKRVWKDSEGEPIKFAWKMKIWEGRGRGIAKVNESY